MKRTLTPAAALALTLFATAPMAQAATSSYNVTTTFFEPMTRPKDSIFIGSFDYDSSTHTVSNLQGKLSESMTGTTASDMTWLSLNYQLTSWYDASLGGTFAAAFKNDNMNTFWTGAGGDGWSPSSGVMAGGVFYGFPQKSANPGNAYALIFVPDSPLTSLTQAQINKLAYADCAPGGMMGSVCMTGTSLAGYGAAGTMDGYPLSQTITTAAVPEPASVLLSIVGLVAVGVMTRRRMAC